MSMPSETTGWNSGGTNNVDPGSAKKILGWVVDEQPASSTFNWILGVIESWLAWLYNGGAGIFGYANTWTGAQTFGGRLIANEAVSLSNVAFGTTGTTQMPDVASATVIYTDGSACVMKLPINPVDGQIHIFKNNGLGTLQVLPPTGRSLDGTSSTVGITLSSQYARLIVQWIATSNFWIVIGS